MYVCALPCEVTRVDIVTKRNVNFMSLLANNLWIKMKLLLSVLSTSFVYVVTVDVQSVHQSL